MISDAETRHTAARLGVDLQIVDLDYVQSCFLASLYSLPEAAGLRFKGGTCLKKCYFGDYRFSKDLDFTATRPISPDRLEGLLDSVARVADRNWQVDFGVRAVKVVVQDDEYGKESYEVRVYYRGPLARRGDPQAIRLHVTRYETLVFPESRRPLLHEYSDADQVSGIEVPCYDLLEVMSEKLRALAGQRTHAISRDVYDIDEISRREKVDISGIATALPKKLVAKGLTVGEIDLVRLAGRKDEFRRDWERNLINLLSPGMAGDFEATWQRVLSFIANVNRRMTSENGR